MRKDIDDLLIQKGVGALFLYSESFQDVNMYYLARFLAPGPFILFKKVGEDPVMVVSQMEYQRACKESIVKDIRPYEDYNFLHIIKSVPEPDVGLAKFAASIAKKEIGTNTKVYVTPTFPAMLADIFRREDLKIVPLVGVIDKARETKDPYELDEIKAVQSAVEKVTRRVLDVIADTDIDAGGKLTARTDGRKETLTVARIKSICWHALIEEGCIFEEDVIVACGPAGADPHYVGNPQDELKANQPIVLDIFPRSLRKRYWTDMTRTIVKGKAPEQIKKMFEAVLEAQNASLDGIKAGAMANEVYDICCNVLEKAGYATTRIGQQITKGFVHVLGHGLGLQIHENPRIWVHKVALEEHNVVTVEPGLYDPALGGIRIEDTVEVTQNGCSNLSRMEKTLEV